MTARTRSRPIETLVTAVRMVRIEDATRCRCSSVEATDAERDQEGCREEEQEQEVEMEQCYEQ